MSFGTILDRACQAVVPDMSPGRDRKVCDLIDAATRATPGKTVRVKLDGVPATDEYGRHAYIVGITFEGFIKITMAGATNDAVSWVDLLSAWGSLFMKNKHGHHYLTGQNDGRALYDDVWNRNHRRPAMPAAGAAVAVNAGAASYYHEVTQFWPLIRIDGVAPSLKGAVSLAELQAAGPEALTFKVPAGAGLAGAPAGIVLDGFDDTGNGGPMRIHLHLVYLPLPFVDTEWTVENYALSGLNGTLPHPDRETEYLHMAPLSEDGHDLTNYGNSSYSVGRRNILPALTVEEVSRRTHMTLAEDIDSDTTDARLDPSAAASSAVTQIIVDRSRTRAARASGPIRYAFTSRTDTETRFAHRTIRARRANHVRDNVRRLTGHANVDALKVAAIDDSGRAVDPLENPTAPIVLTNR